MIDSTISEFYTNKDKDHNYATNYELEHGKRHDEIVEKFNLKEIKNQYILNIGGGLGFLEKRLDPSNKFVIVDGAILPEDKKLCDFIHINADVNKQYNHLIHECGINIFHNFHSGFIMEVIEHLTDPYNCLLQMKELVRINGYIYITIPHESVTHNTLYPGLIYPVQNFIQFLGQMALPIEDYFLFENGFRTHIFKCLNAPWGISKMLFPKKESKFFGKTPLEYCNL